MGIFFAFLSSFAFSVSNLFGKKAAATSDLVPGFVIQYGLVALFALFFGLLSGQPLFAFDFRTILAALMLGVCGYSGIFAYLASSRHMSMGVALSLAYGYVIVLYFVNARIFPSEALSLPKLGVALAFFASIAYFLVSESKKGTGFMKYVWLPMATLVCWTGYFGTANYVVKTGIASPVWSLLLAEGSIFATALVVFLARTGYRAACGSKTRDSWKFPDLASFSSGVSMAVFTALGTGFLLVSYSFVAANLANTIGLFTTVSTAVMSAIVFRERLPKSEWSLIGVCTLLLSLFLIVP